MKLNISTDQFVLATDTLNLGVVSERVAELALQRTRGNVSKAAKLMGIGRATFYRRFINIVRSDKPTDMRGAARYAVRNYPLNVARIFHYQGNELAASRQIYNGKPYINVYSRATQDANEFLPVDGFYENDKS